MAAEAAAGPPADLRQVIEESVTAHLVADVPVSSFLSGGLDSSIVTVLANRAGPGIEAYTITFRPEDQRLEAMPDDAVYARKVAAQYGISLSKEIEISPDIGSCCPRMVDALDEPIGDPAAINTLLMCQAARERGIKVILSGMGADELFGGYRKHLACLMASRYRPRAAGPGAGSRPRYGSPPAGHGGRPRAALRPVGQALPDLRRAPEEPRFPRSYTLYDPPGSGRAAQPGPGRARGRRRGRARARSTTTTRWTDEVNRMCLADTRLFLPGLNLDYTDRSSMAASVEVRTPFVDPVVARAAFMDPRPPEDRRAAGQGGAEAGRGELAARGIVHRPKASFSAPLRAWVRTDLQDVIRDVLVCGELVDTGFLRAGALRQLIADDQAGRQDNSKQIWQLLSLELWYRNAQANGVSA